MLWLTGKEPLPPNYDTCHPTCPIDLWRPVFNKYHPHDLWLYSLLRAVELLLLEHPIFNDVGANFQPSYQNNPGLYKIWPKMSDAMTVFCGAGFSAAEAILDGLQIFLLNTVEYFSYRDIDMPEESTVSRMITGEIDVMVTDVWPSPHPAMKLWRDATIKKAKEYFPPAKWTPADLDGEYSRVSKLLTHEIANIKLATSAETEQSLTPNPEVAKQEDKPDGDKKTTGNISGMRWPEAKKKAEALVYEKGFIGHKKLYEAIGCSDNTLRKAIVNSPKLQEAKEQYKSTSKTLKAVGFTAKVIATYETSSGPKLSDAEADEILTKMMGRIKREQPEMFEPTKKQLDEMPSDGKREFAAIYQRDYQNKDESLSKNGPKTQRQYKQV